MIFMTLTTKERNFILKILNYNAIKENNNLNIFLNTMDTAGKKFSHAGHGIGGDQLNF